MRIVSKRERLFPIVTIALGVIVLGAMTRVLWPRGAQFVKTGDSPVVQQPQLETLTSTTLFTGNIYWGRYLNDWSRKSDLGTAYSFSRLHEFNRESYQNWA